LVDVLYVIVSVSVLPFWALMILAPGWPRTRAAVAGPWVVAVPVLVYLGLALGDPGAFAEAFARPGLAGVAALLGSPRGAVLAWAHLLAFDLLVGRGVYHDARDRGVPAWVSGPVLLLVALAGPLGLAAYALTRAVRERHNR
jgi:hypothetical protein